MSDGTALIPFKSALITALQARAALTGVSITQEPLVKELDLQGSTGNFEVITLGNATWTQYEPEFLGVAVVLNEVFELDVVIQVLKINSTADTQANADARASQLLREVIGTISATPDLGLSPTSGVTLLWVLPKGNSHTIGWLGKGDQHGSRFDLKIEVTARLALT